jgi:hypothetical protein
MSPHVEVIFNRTKLYGEVWSEPVRTVAKRYEISDVALAKTCRKLNVPLPPRGYWARSPERREVGRRALPELKAGEPEEIKRGYWRYPEHEGSEPEKPARPPLHVEADIGPPIRVPETLPEEPHRLVKRARRVLKLPSYGGHGLLGHQGRSLDIRVSPACLDRALRLMEGLLAAFEARGWRVDLTAGNYYDPRSREVIPPDGKPNSTRVRVDDEWVYLAVVERYSLVPDPAEKAPRGLRGTALDQWRKLHRPRRHPVPNGIVELRFECSPTASVIKDGKRERIEEKLGDVPQSLKTMAARAKVYRVEMEELRKRREEEEKRRAAQERREWEARRRREQREAEDSEIEQALARVVRRWRLAAHAREYILELAGLVEGRELPEATLAAVRKQLEWVKACAARLDPLDGLRHA